MATKHKAKYNLFLVIDRVDAETGEEFEIAGEPEVEMFCLDSDIPLCEALDAFIHIVNEFTGHRPRRELGNRAFKRAVMKEERKRLEDY